MTSKKKWRQPTKPLPPTKSTPGLGKFVPASIIAIVTLVVVFFIVLSIQTTSKTEGGNNSAIDYAIGRPGPGAMAPNFSLPSTSGGVVNLVDYRGKTILLFFHEGIGCQPCWDQIRDLEKATTELRSSGIDELLTITSGPVRLIAQKMADDRLTAIALADVNLAVSKIYQANQFGMMGDSRDGHSFILVGPDGRIDWRADYGGPPKYTMYVPLKKILSDMKAGRRAA